MELLVVVAIIAIIAALLLPGLKEAREKARQAICRNNLKEISSAMYMYANEYGGHIPYQRNRDWYYWDYYIGFYLNVPTSWWSTQEKSKALTCPTAYSLHAGDSFYAGPASTYACNHYAWNYDYPPYGGKRGCAVLPRLGGFDYAEELMAVGDGDYCSGGYWQTVIASIYVDWGVPAIDYGWMWGEDDHSGGTNYLFFDGHVSWIHEKEKYTMGLNEADYDNPVTHFWNPFPYDTWW